MVPRSHDGLGVREARSSDVPKLTELLNDIIRMGGTTAMETPLSEVQFSCYFLTGTNALFCHVALENSSGDPIGFQAVGRHRDLPEGWGDIATFARPHLKVRGVGTILFPQTLRRAADGSISVLNAMIRADNTPGLAYYRKIGFVTYRTLEAFPLDSGRRVDRILKRYDIA